ncbi:rhomboid family intramembrane serine protease [Aquibacillus sp. 3ASR75-11]|uniref:Rhomboid family intramembrane serine protease n=1 Tax=Terrihalobacillus insolitus TaxID=2950438 RepID=A0A9X4AME2_9BACI|nr:rhomboid family intramembrane serine protease [Terrihalobacillus insolitus]MDC3425201.1 rhomboid family intramembrane serine protease [Terrihalobacillus insolitus]
MFFRTESFQQFVRTYPIVTTLVSIHLFLWVIIDLFQLNIGMQIYQWGAGVNLMIDNGEYWRLITPIVLHAGLMHALFNSFSLVLFGPALEQMLGKFKFIVAYFFAGIVGNLFTYVMDPTAFYPYVGASGAIYGLFGIYLFMTIFRKHLIDQANGQIILTIFIIGMIMSFLRTNINIYAHIFGFIGGFAIAPVVLRNARPFNIWSNRSVHQGGGVNFNPNRWKGNRWRNKQRLNKVVWVLLGALVLLGLFNRLF